jgi:hypothetical protein
LLTRLGLALLLFHILLTVPPSFQPSSQKLVVDEAKPGMSGTTIRKACDRCHGQKLSCRRLGLGTCELKTECRYSPSLRYTKHHDQHHESQHKQQKQQKRQQRQPLIDHDQEAGCTSSRGDDDDALACRRTQIFPTPVQPETGRCYLSSFFFFISHFSCIHKGYHPCSLFPCFLIFVIAETHTNNFKLPIVC